MELSTGLLLLGSIEEALFSQYHQAPATEDAHGQIGIDLITKLTGQSKQAPLRHAQSLDQVPFGMAAA